MSGSMHCLFGLISHRSLSGIRAQFHSKEQADRQVDRIGSTQRGTVPGTCVQFLRIAFQAQDRTILHFAVQSLLACVSDDQPLSSPAGRQHVSSSLSECVASSSSQLHLLRRLGQAHEAWRPLHCQQVHLHLLRLNLHWTAKSEERPQRTLQRCRWASALTALTEWCRSKVWVEGPSGIRLSECLGKSRLSTPASWIGSKWSGVLRTDLSRTCRTSHRMIISATHHPLPLTSQHRQNDRCTS